MKTQRKINKQRENNEIYCFCPYLVKEVSCFNHFPFAPLFTDVLSENRENTHLNHIYKGFSIVLFSFSIVLLAISWYFFCFSYFRYNFWKNRCYGFKFWQCYGLIILFKNWNLNFQKLWKYYCSKGYQFSLLFKQRFFCIRFGSYLREKHTIGLKCWQTVESGKVYAIM